MAIMSDAPAGNITVSKTDLSCRLPLLVLFLSAAVWFLLGSLAALLVSIKFHAPNFLADHSWLSYGRLQPAGYTALLYGGCLQAGLGVGLWLLATLGQTLAQRIATTAGAIFWNLGVTMAVAGILVGDSTGFPNLELPSYSLVSLFVGYVLVGLCSVLLFHHRRELSTFPSQWYLLAALFWFPWIFSTAELLLVAFPVRGVAQSVIAWWYSDNLLIVWLGLVGLAAAFYFVARDARRPLHSHYLALFTFWMLVLFGSYGGIPTSAPLPAWLPTVSTIATVLLLIPILAVAVNVHRTLAGGYPVLRSNTPLRFIVFGVGAFVAAGLMKIGGALGDADQQLHFTWFSTGRNQLHVYGFFAMVMFGAAYDILPRLIGQAFPSRGLVRLHFWASAGGVVLLVVPLAIAGITQDLQFVNPRLAFLDISKSSLPFLRVSTIGDLLVLLGQGLFLVNLAGLVVRFYRARATAAYSIVTADLYKPAGAKA